jgi:hypothetical protein
MVYGDAYGVAYGYAYEVYAYESPVRSPVEPYAVELCTTDTVISRGT